MTDPPGQTAVSMTVTEIGKMLKLVVMIESQPLAAVRVSTKTPLEL